MRLNPPVSARDHVRGNPNAPIVFVEYGDYQCPHCGRAHEVLTRLERRLGPAMQLAYRNFPLTQIHPRALPAALLAEAAAVQGAFWPMHDLLYENQDALEDEDLSRYAEVLGLDTARLTNDAPAAHARIREDVASGARSGVNGTPTFFLNGVRYDGPWWDEAHFASVLAEVARRAAVPV
jgi:protein-disulfide isomerase